jgi:hypothetical protein
VAIACAKAWAEALSTATISRFDSRLLAAAVSSSKQTLWLANCYFRQATSPTSPATLLHPFLYVIGFKRALNFGEAQGTSLGAFRVGNPLEQVVPISDNDPQTCYGLANRSSE